MRVLHGYVPTEVGVIETFIVRDGDTAYVDDTLIDGHQVDLSRYGVRDRNGGWMSLHDYLMDYLV